MIAINYVITFSFSLSLSRSLYFFGDCSPIIDLVQRMEHMVRNMMSKAATLTECQHLSNFLNFHSGFLQKHLQFSVSNFILRELEPQLRSTLFPPFNLCISWIGIYNSLFAQTLRVYLCLCMCVRFFVGSFYIFQLSSLSFYKSKQNKNRTSLK